MYLLVPPGVSPHSFEPTPKQILKTIDAGVWFRIGESFEPRVLRVLKNHNPGLVIIDTRQGIDLMVSSHSHAHDEHCDHDHHHHDHASAHADELDSHIWLSPKLTKTQAETITTALSAYKPEHQELYKENLAKLLQELDTLDTEITAILAHTENRTFITPHPAFAYFCRDYGLKELSLEISGKEIGPQQLTHLLKECRAEKVSCALLLQPYNNKGTQRIAHELNARTTMVDPYSEQYFETLKAIAIHIATDTSS